MDCILAAALTFRVGSNKTAPEADPSSPLAHFVCVAPPPVSISDFILILRQFASPTDSVVAVVLLDRLLQKAGGRLHPSNAHRLLLTATLVSVKLRHDEVWVDINADMADSCGVAVGDVNTMESIFLNLLEWECAVRRNEYDDCLKSMHHLCEAKLFLARKPSALRALVRMHRTPPLTPHRPHGEPPRSGRSSNVEMLK
eukprot:Hpha_TRINITY_DN16860_c2_g3::TRINITY_DN16860_c2_g3_i1::g.153356::m.153356